MAFTVDKCDTFDGLKCIKCGRLMPDICADHEDMAKKAAAFDKMTAEKVEAADETPAPVKPTVKQPVKRRSN